MTAPPSPPGRAVEGEPSEARGALPAPSASGSLQTPAASPPSSRFLDVDFQACAWGARRDKWTRLRCSGQGLLHLAKRCPGVGPGHRHAAWGFSTETRGSWRFATAQEAEYPDALCEAVAEALSRPGSSVLELCAGCANLSLHFAKRGVDVHPFDHAANEHTPLVDTACCDLSSETGQQAIWDLLRRPGMRWALVWIAVPCGTFSRAREIPVPLWLRQRGAPQPVPLRSEAEPEGLPGLRPQARARVLAANSLADFAAKLLDFGDKNDVLVVVENPRRSILWHMPLMRAAAAGPLPGGGPPAVAAPAGPTAAPEAAGVGAAPPLRRKRPHVAPVEAQKAARRAAAFLQPKHSITDALLPEFASTSSLPLLPAELKAASDAGRKWLRDPLPFSAGTLPVGAKIISLSPHGSLGGEEGGAREESGAHVYFGIPASQEEFLRTACSIAVHPFDVDSGAPDDILEAIFTAMTLGPEGLQSHRESTLASWEARAEALAARERALHERMHDGAAAILSGAKLLLLKELLDQAEWGDTNLAGDLAAGMPIVGDIPLSGIFPEVDRPAELSIPDLWRSARGRRAQLFASIRPAHRELDEALLAGTRAEFQAGTMRGPYTIQEAEARWGAGTWLPARRFCISQGTKLVALEDGSFVEKQKFRQIDDYSEVGHNSAAHLRETIVTDGVDSTVGVVKAWARAAAAQDGRVRVQLSDGRLLEGERHAGWGEGPLLQGCLEDLVAAYRQVPRRESQRAFFTVVYWDCDANGIRAAEHLGQPFGASAAVNNFNRLGRGLRALLVRLLRIPATQYYDDFTLVDVLGPATGALVERALALLGFRATSKGDAQPVFDSLGINFDLRNAIGKGYVVISNTERRRESILALLDEIEEAGRLPPALAASLRGKLGFFGSQLFGRVGRAGLRPLVERQYAGPGPCALTPPLRRVLSFWRALVLHARPRVVPLLAPEVAPLVLFTDGWQGDGAKGEVGAGAVLWDPDDSSLLFFGVRVAEEVQERWAGAARKRMLINQAELFPQLLARTTWAGRLRDRRLLAFVDNDGCRDALINGYSAVEESGHILGAVALMDHKLMCLCWYSRVPSPSNIADGPSRGDSSRVLAVGGGWSAPRSSRRSGTQRAVSCPRSCRRGLGMTKGQLRVPETAMSVKHARSHVSTVCEFIDGREESTWWVGR